MTLVNISTTKRTQLEIMRKDLKLLPWLTAEQAITALRQMTETDLTVSDLLSHCQYHNCEAFITATGLRGIAASPFSTGEHEWSYRCFATGPQKVINPEVLGRTAGISKLYLQGPVRTAEDEYAPIFKDCEWEVEVDPTALSIQFSTTAIQALAELINGPAKPLASSERKSLHTIIAVLLAECAIDPTTPFAAHAVLAAAAAKHGIVFKLTDDTVAKHVTAASASVS